MKYIKYILITLALTGIFTLTTQVHAQNPASTTPNGYILLEPLPCKENTPGCVGGKLVSFDPAQPNNLSVYLNIMIRIFIGICAVLSVVMIVMGGLEYMTSELTHSKEAGKEKITHAIFGLLIALGAYALLNTINPNLLNTETNIPDTTATQIGSCTYLYKDGDITEQKTKAACDVLQGEWRANP